MAGLLDDKPWGIGLLNGANAPSTPAQPPPFGLVPAMDWRAPTAQTRPSEPELISLDHHPSLDTSSEREARETLAATRARPSGLSELSTGIASLPHRLARSLVDAYRTARGTNPDPRLVPTDRDPNALTPDDQAAMMPETYANPVAKNLLEEVGALGPLRRVMDAAAVDGRHYVGEPGYVPQAIGPTTELATMLMGGAPTLAEKAAGVGGRLTETIGDAAKSLESRSARLYNPPDKPPRPFEEDYPGGGVADESGRLQFDIEGRPLVGAHIVGRRMVRGADEALLPSQFAAVSEGSIGSAPQAVEARALPRRSVGAYRDIRGPDGPERSIVYLKSLEPAAAEKVVGHELGHMIDELSGQIPIDGLNIELRRLYNTLYSGQERTRNPTGPEHLGYKPDMVPRELMAEAIRAYMVNPNYIKRVAPHTAARIREYANNNPRINRTIQFNSGGGGAPFLVPDQSQ